MPFLGNQSRRQFIGIKCGDPCELYPDDKSSAHIFLFNYILIFEKYNKLKFS